MDSARKTIVILIVWMLLPTMASTAIGWLFLQEIEQLLAHQKEQTHNTSFSHHPTLKETKETKHRTNTLKISYLWASLALFIGTIALSILSSLYLLHTHDKKLRLLRHQLHLSLPELFHPQAEHERKNPFLALSMDLQELLTLFKEQQQNDVFREQVARWQDVARRLAHEIRNPLTPILLASQELQKRYRGNDAKFQKQLNTSVEIIKEEVETLRRLVEEFSSFAKLPQIQAKQEEMNQVIRDFLEAYNWFRDQVQLTFTSDHHEYWASIDRTLFRQVLVNLVQNAIEAGAPSIAIHMGQLPNQQLILQIEDCGPGIPSHLQSKIFTPYFTTKQLGTGLGLSITKKIMIDHGGTITVAPRPEGGTVFTIRLKALSPPSHPHIGNVA